MPRSISSFCRWSGDVRSAGRSGASVWSEEFPHGYPRSSISINRPRIRREIPRIPAVASGGASLLPGGVTHMARASIPSRLYVDRCEGAHKWDVDGNRYIDYWMGHGAMLLAMRTQLWSRPYVSRWHVVRTRAGVPDSKSTGRA